MSKIKLTQREISKVRALERIAASWPKNLWLWAGGGELYVMKKKNGEREMTAHGGYDPDYLVAHLHDIESDGGDW